MIRIERLQLEDIPLLVEAFAPFYIKTHILFENYLDQQKNKSRVIWVARYDDTVAGYITLAWYSSYEPFLHNSIPEIMDLNVIPPLRCKGIATQLLDRAEKIAFGTSNTVGLGVGLTADYGLAQKLYIKRGYMTDGCGITYKYKSVEYNQTVAVDDDLILWFVKKKK